MTMADSDEVLPPMQFAITGMRRAFADEEGVPLATHTGVSDPSPRWAAKANAFTAGWTDTFTGDFPSMWCVALGLAVAQHETYCGDAWAGEHNWGGVQLGGLNLDEKKCLDDAGISPTPQNVPAARAALALRGLTRAGGALHVDSSPANGGFRYFTWFAAFSTDEAGAAHFIHVLAGNRAGCKAALLAAVGAWKTDSAALAAAMYKTGYYEGFHDPKLPGGADANIADYASAILSLAPSIYANLALQGWTPSPGRPVFDLTCVMGYQSALTYLAGKLRNHAYDPLGVDGVLGPHTIAAIKVFQTDQAIPVTATMNEQTLNMLKYALSIVPDQGVQVLSNVSPATEMPVAKS
jgi:hypothetical protein